MAIDITNQLSIALVVSCFLMPNVKAQSLESAGSAWSVGSTDTKGLYFEESSGQPQGGIIIRYPDADEARMRRIGRYLSDHGWSSVLIPLSTRDVVAAPQRSTQEVVEEMASERGQRNLVLLTVGNTWDTDINITSLGENTSAIQGLILVDVPGDIPFVKDFPTLDISTTLPSVPGHKQRQKRARKSRITTAQSLSIVYSTRRTPAPNLEGPEDQLSKRIRGWLHQNLRGMEITELEP